MPDTLEEIPVFLIKFAVNRPKQTKVIERKMNTF